MYFQDFSSIVIDAANLYTRAGYSGQDTPRYIIPSYLGTDHTRIQQQTLKYHQYYYAGDTKLSLKNNNMEINNVFSHGKIVNYDLYENLLLNMLEGQMKCEYKQYSLLLSEDNFHNRQQREKIAEIIFEKFDIKNLFFSKNAVLSCFATGRSTGLVFDSGSDFSTATTVHEGFALNRTNQRYPVAGETLTKLIQLYLQNQLKVEAIPRNLLNNEIFTNSYKNYHKNILLRDLKQNIYKLDELNQQSSATIQYQLPDKKVIKIQKNKIADPFFSSYNNDTAYKGLHHLIAENISQCDIDIKKQLYSNIIVTGGNSLLGGFLNKLHTKLSQIIPPNAKLKLISFPFPIQRKFSSWIGGSILTSLSSFQSFWVGKQQWRQFRRNIIQKKCS